MVVAVYALCVLTSTLCAVLLWREYRRTGARLLLWSSLAFVGWAANHGFVFLDVVIWPGNDLSVVRTLLALTATSLLLYGLVWDAA